MKTWGPLLHLQPEDKGSLHTKAPLGKFLPPSERLQYVHIDLIGSLPLSKGFSYLLICIDRFTRWQEAIPIRDCRQGFLSQLVVTLWSARDYND